uniref:Cobalt-precorrin-5B (C(1))-methyltransferase n=1 Tax=Archaeoglobus fulgidus TaxID=2234 RepID=A0A7J2TI26_ARCFL
MLRDPVELYEYPEDWCIGRESLVKSGLFILKRNGFIRRGITTATAASAAIVAAVASLKHEFDSVSVLTPVGIEINLEVEAEKGFAVVEKFSGDHEFDVTDGLEFFARVKESGGIEFGEGIGEKDGKKAVSRSAMRQIEMNFERVCRKTGYKGGVSVEAPDGKEVAKETKNEELGIKGGISILGTTGFVEPWCEELVKVKIEIAGRYRKIAITTGRRAWEYARKKYPDFQPFVFGLHLDEILSEHKGEKIIVGYPGLLKKWAKNEDLFEKARSFGAEVDLIAEDYWSRNM